MTCNITMHSKMECFDKRLFSCKDTLDEAYTHYTTGHALW